MSYYPGPAVPVLQRGVKPPPWRLAAPAPGEHLHYACLNGHLDEVKQLLASRVDVSMKNRSGWTALHDASRYGFDEIVRLLIEAAADIEAADENGITALHKASRNGYAAVVQELVDANCDVNAVNRSGWCALFFAATNGYADVVDILLRAKADVNATTEGNKETALHLACNHGKLGAIEVLINHGAEALIRNDEGATPAKRAIDGGFPMGYTLLREKLSQRHLVRLRAAIVEGDRLQMKDDSPIARLVVDAYHVPADVSNIIIGFQRRI